MTARALGQDDEQPRRADDIPPELAEALIAQHLGRHYREWVDAPIPALDGKTPREAAKNPVLRTKLEGLLGDLEGAYQRSLRDRTPAYDPSWMWLELGLRSSPTDAAHPPPLAHERVAERVAGSAEASRAIADRLRRASDHSAVLDERTFDADLDAQRFLRSRSDSANESGREPAAAAPYLRWMINLELLHRKIFWVDEPLAYMLGQTDAEVSAPSLRAPFASFALVFTDRQTLSLGERLLSRRGEGPLVGHILRVATVYVVEHERGDARLLEICFAFDALGADLPSLVCYQLALSEEATIGRAIDAIEPRTLENPDLPDASPVRGLLRLVCNAILYATSAGVTSELRVAPTSSGSKPRNGEAPAFSSDEVYFLPGKIEISSVRRLQELERAPDGRKLLRRFLVRGHWRRPQKDWSDQRLRWVEPYWKGPEMAAVIERAYRLTSDA